MKNSKKSECPIPLKKWLDRINDVPFKSSNKDDWLYSWDRLVSNAYFELTGRDISPLLPPSPEYDYGTWETPSHEDQEMLDKAHQKALILLKENMMRFPHVYSYLYKLEDTTPPENKWNEIRFNSTEHQYEKTAYQRYEIFLQMRADLRAIAEKCMSYQKNKRFIDNDAILERLGFKRRDKGHRTEFIIKDGIINFESELTQILKNVPSERLRICPICDEIFWAKRFESSTCSNKKCSNNYHQRKIRIKEYEDRLDKEYKKYEKIQSTLPPESPLIKEQRKTVNKLIEKINTEKMKNGTL